MKILVAEDDRALNSIIERNLIDECYTVDTVFDGIDALDYLLGGNYDLALLDIMMPGLSGKEVLARYKEEGGDTPIIFLTALTSIDERVSGLDSGASDYITKPFSLEELNARIRAALRRGKKTTQSNILSVADLSLDTGTHQVKRGNRIIHLSAKEYTVLEYLLKEKGAIRSREQIMDHAWNSDTMVESNVIDVYIRYLRKKIDDGHEVKLIHTIRGMGYSIMEDNK